MKLSFLFIFFFLLVLTPFVSAQPPFQQQTTFTEGYEIQFPAFGAIRQNEDFTFAFHVSNISNGVPITNASTDCIFHLFDISGEHVIMDNDLEYVLDHGVINEWEVLVLGGNFSRLGDYNYLVSCNSTVLGGFESIHIDVTADGNEKRVFSTQFQVILFGLILIIFGLTRERYRILQIGGGLVWMVMGVLTLFPGYNLINWTTLTGKALGFILIGVGFYLSVEPAFSRDGQAKYFNERGGDNERR